MITVLTSGVYTTLQDQGRFGYRDQGVPVSGVMDAISARLANVLLGNDVECAVLEVTMLGPNLLFHENAVLVFTGANFNIEVNGISKTLNQPFEIHKGQILRIKNPSVGVRGYLAIKGGFVSEIVLGSQSQYKGITQKGKIDKNDILKFKNKKQQLPSLKTHIKNQKPFFETSKVSVFKGPEFDKLPLKIQEKLKTEPFTVSHLQNRMGIQLDGVGVVSFEELVTVPVQPGTVQLTPSGTLIIVMKDGQTTGGYPRVLQCTEKSIAILAQKQPASKIAFKFE